MLPVVVQSVDHHDVERDEKHEAKGAKLDELHHFETTVDCGKCELVSKLEDVDEDLLLDDGHVGLTSIELFTLGVAESLADLEPDLDVQQGQDDHKD